MSEAPLVPRQSAAPATRPAAGKPAPTSPLSRLAKPLHVISVMGDTIFYYLKVGAAKGSVSLRNLPPEVAREVAMITVNHAAKRFTLQWYPWADQPQVVQDLPLEQLSAVVDDLCMAGFAAPVALASPEATKQGQNPCNSPSLTAGSPLSLNA